MLLHQCRAARRGADERLSGVADRTGAAARSTSSATGLVSDGAKHPIGDHPTRSDRAQYSRSGGIFPHGLNAPKRVERSRSGVFLPMERILFEALRRGRSSAGILPRRCLGPSRDQHALSYIPSSDTMLERVAASPPGSDPRAGGPPFSYHSQARRPGAQCLGQNRDVRSVPSCNGGAIGRAHSAWGVSSR